MSTFVFEFLIQNWRVINTVLPDIILKMHITPQPQPVSLPKLVTGSRLVAKSLTKQDVLDEQILDDLALCCQHYSRHQGGYLLPKQ